MRVEPGSRDTRGSGNLAAMTITTRRGAAHSARRDRLATLRLLHVAAETGARFVRDRIDLEPLDWLLAGRHLFDGRNAVDACSGVEGFRRAIVLHGLSLGLDASPQAVSRIPAHAFLSEMAAHLTPGLPPRHGEPEDWKSEPLALYTSTISAELHDGHVQIFGAMIARTPLDVRRRLRQRYGPLLEDQAVVRLGFDWSEPLACAMVSEAMAHVLKLAAEHPASALANGLDFHVEQRFSQ